MFHILGAIDTARNEGTAGSENKAENHRKDVCQVPILVGDVGSHQVVSIGTRNLNWYLSKDYLHQGNNITLNV